jgi:hypothetical protein
MRRLVPEISVAQSGRNVQAPGWDRIHRASLAGSTLRLPWMPPAIYVDRILKGATPATLPVEECTRFRLVVNLKAARAFGVRVPKAA